MKPTPFNHKFLIYFIFITFKSASPLLVGVALRGVALKCSVPHLPISAIYGLIWMKPTPFNHKFLIDYISITFKVPHPFWWVWHLGVWHLSAQYLIYLSQPIIDPFRWNHNFIINYILIILKIITSLLVCTALRSVAL